MFVHVIVENIFLLYRMGKTTLLKHIADRKLAIPPNIDVLYCEQGMYMYMYMSTFCRYGL